MMPWMSQPRPQLLAHFICVWRVFCQPAHCVFDGNVPTVQAVTRSHFTKATVRPNRAVCESEQNEGHERFYVWCYIIWCYILKTPSGREALELICYALRGNMKKKLRGVCAAKNISFCSYLLAPSSGELLNSHHWCPTARSQRTTIKYNKPCRYMYKLELLIYFND